MNKYSSPQVLLASATLLLSAAYFFILHEQTSYAVLTSILFVPAIASAFSLFFYKKYGKRFILNIALLPTSICITFTSLYLYFVFKVLHTAGVQFDSSFAGLLYVLPLGYLLALAVGSLLLKK